MNAYEINQLASGIEVGDTVKVLAKAEPNERGWSNVWPLVMDNFVGETFVVNQVTTWGISNGVFAFPYFVLEIVKKADK